MTTLLLLIFSLVITVPWTTSQPLSIDQAISNAATEVRDASLLWDDASILVELDMRFTPEQWKAIQKSRNDNGRRRRKRKAYRPLVTRWDNGIVNYRISQGFYGRDQGVIREAMKEWSRVSCIQFNEVSADSTVPSINFVPTGGCSSNVGKTGRVGQLLTLGNGCIYKGIIIHELGHALGFFHEQSRPDRDSFVNIHTENIVNGMTYNFEKYSSQVINTYGIGYDLKSIMHYGPYYFSKNGQMTISAKSRDETKLIGNRYGLTFNDIHLANKMYRCSKNCGSKSCRSNAFLGKDCRCWCRGPTDEKPVIYCDTGDSIPDSTNSGVRPTRRTTRPTRPTVTETLTDLSEYCQQWAAHGYCSTNEYTKINCKRSCSLIGRTTTAPDGDRHSNCAMWASIGECDINPGYMLVMCKKSCRNVASSCEDTVPMTCKIYRDQCNSRVLGGIMKKFCRYTCNACTMGERITACADTATRSCRLVAKLGHCLSKDKKTRTSAQFACPQSCHQCARRDSNCWNGGCSQRGRSSESRSHCVDRLPFCPSWKDKCNSPFLRDTTKLFCRKTCKLC